MNEELILNRIKRLEDKQEDTEEDIEEIKTSLTVQGERTAQLFGIMQEIKGSLQRIEQGIYNREDPFKKAMFDIGMWSIKVLVGGGTVMWAASKFGN